MWFVAILAAVLVAPRGALAWGALGHSTIGFVAMQVPVPHCFALQLTSEILLSQFINSATLKQVQTILGSDFDETLGGDAASVRYPGCFGVLYYDALMH